MVDEKKVGNTQHDKGWIKSIQMHFEGIAWLHIRGTSSLYPTDIPTYFEQPNMSPDIAKCPRGVRGGGKHKPRITRLLQVPSLGRFDGKTGWIITEHIISFWKHRNSPDQLFESEWKSKHCFLSCSAWQPFHLALTSWLRETCLLGWNQFKWSHCWDPCTLSVVCNPVFLTRFPNQTSFLSTWKCSKSVSGGALKETF